MKLRKLLWRSLVYYRKTQIWVVLGTMISTSVLVGALIIGDSVRSSLREVVLRRLGKTEFALTSGERFFRLRMADQLARILKIPVAPLLQTRGIAVIQGGRRRLNRIQILGVDSRFGEMADCRQVYDHLSVDEVIVNEPLAKQLQLKKGDEILLRMVKLAAMPQNTPLTVDTEVTLARPFTVKKIVSPSQFGSFNLSANQVPPRTAFVSLKFLAKEMGIDNNANVLLISQKPADPLNLEEVKAGVKKVWTLADAGLELRDIAEKKLIELKSNRVFLDPPITKIALKVGGNPQAILTYFVNELKYGDQSTPYSFVSAPGAPIVPVEMKDNEIIINEWLARDLGAQPKNQIQLAYFVLGPARDLIEVTSNFRIRTVVPIKGPYADGDLMPHLPGLSEQENCSDWNPGIPIDLKKIRKKDEIYWDNFRGIPKAFITLKMAQQMWKNRFGDLTAIRFHSLKKENIEAELLERLNPGSLGLNISEVRKDGLAASSHSVDFAQLFLGMSFFLIFAAMLLTGLLYVFNMEQRSGESGLLIALGFPKKVVNRLVLMEGTILIFVGSILGGIAGVLYNQILLLSLKTVWRGVVGTSALELHLRIPSIITGVGIGTLVAFLTIWVISNKNTGRTIKGLQSGLTRLAIFQKKKPWFSIVLVVIGVLAVSLILIFTKFETGREAFAFFFMAGSMLLMSGISLVYIIFLKMARTAKDRRMNLRNIGIRNNVRRPLRSLTLIGLLASGLFIIFTVGANRIGTLKDGEVRESGTGGFRFFGETAIPVLYNLNTSKGSRFYGIDQLSSKGVSYVHFRVKEGDDASCLNLNQVSHPQLIGVNPEELIKRGSFTFAETTAEVNSQNPWAVLKKNLSSDVIPAIADRTVIIWGLGKRVGDTLTYVDERGETFKIKLVAGLANSVFQGNIIISEDAFLRRYPSTDGFRLFLIDAPLKKSKEIYQGLTWALQDQGLDLILAAERLTQFNKVENTYLSIFLILGGFALVLGSIGLGIVVWRNVAERKDELALLRALGFSKKSILRLVLWEHLALLIAGLFLGITAAFIATLPSIISPGSQIPFSTLIVILITVLINGCLWTLGATFKATKGALLPALRNE